MVPRSLTDPSYLLKLKDVYETQLAILNKVISSFQEQTSFRFGVPKVLSDAEGEAYLIEAKIKAVDEMIKGLPSHLQVTEPGN